MTIIEKLESTIHQALGEQFPFYYDTPSTLNLRLDNARFPCAFLHVIESGAVRNDVGILREQLTCQILFTAPSNLDFDGIENERIINELKQNAFIWLQILNRNDLLTLDSIDGTTRLYATEDAILTAFGVTIRVTEIEGVTPCDVPNVNY